MENILSQASIGETADVTNNVSTAIRKANIADDYLNNENNSLKESSEKMVAGMGAIRKKELSEEIDAADSKRDSLLSAFILMLRGFRHWNKEETLGSANLLSLVVKSHGNNFSRLSNEKESAVYDSLLGELEKEKNMEAVNALGLSQLVADMKAAEENFRLLYQQSAELESEKTELITPSSIKRETQQKLNNLISYLDVMSRVNAPTYGALAANVALLVETINSKIRVRLAGTKSSPLVDAQNN